MWEAVEREQGKYDFDYLDKVNDLITKLGEYGIYTLVDAHQDVLARVICGEGIPDFYAKQIIKSETEPGQNHPACISAALDPILLPIL